MRIRMIIAFVVVALVGAVTALVVFYLLNPERLAWLYDGNLPSAVRHLYSSPQSMKHLSTGGAVVVALAAAAVLAVIVGVAVAASRRVLLPVQRLAGAARRMSGGDLSVRVEPRGRDELAQLMTTFNDMAAALEDKVGELRRMEARARQFAGDVSHELRTPLTAMTAVADILRDYPGVTPDAAAAAQLVGQEIRHLNRLVDDLIEISRFDAGTAQLVADETDIATTVERCLRARNWTGVQTEVPAGLAVRLDRRRFDVIVANLVGNALRHGAPPVTVAAGVQRDSGGGQQLVLAVRDHGPGLPAAAIPHVFDRFYKADSARSRSEGSGLGLAIAWENARLHGGRIDVSNHPGGGAVFIVRLPLDRSPRQSDVEPATEPALL